VGEFEFEICGGAFDKLLDSVGQDANVSRCWTVDGRSWLIRTPRRQLSALAVPTSDTRFGFAVDKHRALGQHGNGEQFAFDDIDRASIKSRWSPERLHLGMGR